MFILLELEISSHSYRKLYGKKYNFLNLNAQIVKVKGGTCESESFNIDLF